MTNLKRENFAAIARKGCFVYCYLRTSDGSPYYIGIASQAYRATSKDHRVRVPADRARIRVMRSGLTWEEAASWEKFYISRYGRKDINTGILRNLTDGGEGTTGWICTEDTKQKISAANTGKRHKLSAKMKTEKTEHLRRAMAKDGYFAKRSESKIRNSARKLGVNEDRYLAAPFSMRQAVERRIRRGVTGEDLWLPENIQPRTARMCRSKGICLEAYSQATREIQSWVRKTIDCGKPIPEGFAAA